MVKELPEPCGRRQPTLQVKPPTSTAQSTSTAKATSRTSAHGSVSPVGHDGQAPGGVSTKVGLTIANPGLRELIARPELLPGPVGLPDSAATLGRAEWVSDESTEKENKGYKVNKAKKKRALRRKAKYGGHRRPGAATGLTMLERAAVPSASMRAYERVVGDLVTALRKNGEDLKNDQALDEGVDAVVLRGGGGVRG